MKAYSTHFAILALLLASSIPGCMLLEKEAPSASATPEIVPVSIDFRINTKSSINPDEDALEDVNIYVFHDGELYQEKYVDDFSCGIELRLIAGDDFDIYVLGNYGCHPSGYMHEGEFEDRFRVEITDVGELDHILPMAAIYFGYNTSIQGRTLHMDLERLTSRIGFQFRNSIPGSTLRVSAVRLCQAPREVFPFNPWGSTPLSASQGDYASSEDIARVNAGQTIYFYSLENMQGFLLPYNTDPWQKTPENLPDAVRNLCTYIEVTCSFGPGSFQDGDLIYKFYPGWDSCTDFSIPRNTQMTVSLEATPTGLSLSNWKVDNFSMYTDGHASCSIESGMHDTMDELYIGESFTLEIEADDLLVEYFFEDMTGAKMCLLNDSYEKDSAISFGSIRKDGARWLVDGRCEGSINGGELWLMDRWGNLVQNLETGVNVLAPSVALSSDSGVRTGQIVPAATDATLTINSVPSQYTIYLTDSSGKNLGGPFFDNTLFNLSGTFHAAGSTYNALTGLHNASITPHTAHETSFGTINLALSNTGSSPYNSRLLSDAIVHKPIRLRVHDAAKGVTTEFGTTPAYLPIEIDYDCTSRTFTFVNPSRLPLEMTLYDMSIFTEKTGNSLTTSIGLNVPFSAAGTSHKVVRYDAVNYYRQNFGASEIQTLTLNPTSDITILDMGQDMPDHLYYAQFHRQNAGAGSFSRTWSVADIALSGQSQTYPATNISTGTGSYCSSPSAPGQFEGLAIFSLGDFVCASEGLEPSSDRRAGICSSLSYAVYSPSTIQKLRGRYVAVDFDPIVEDGCTVSVSSLVGSEGEDSRISVAYEVGAAVTTHPNGTWRDAQHFWAAPSSYLTSLYLNTDQSIYTSANLTVNPQLRASKTCTLFKGIRYYDVVPLKNLIDLRVFHMTSTDSYNSLGSANSFEHQYHPISCSILAEMSTTSQSTVYRTNLSGMLTNPYYYKNSKYTGPGDDATTAWMYRNTKGGNSGSEAISTGTCYLFDLQ